MDCPICLKKMGSNSVDPLSVHLRDEHSFDPFNAGRVAQKVRYWREYDAVEAQDIERCAAYDTGDNAGRLGQRVGDSCALSSDLVL